jgi:16S rRNA (uracil1498-N3)-methyltransferase
VTAPLFWVDGGRLDETSRGDHVVLDGPEGRHAATVRRIAAGELVDLSDGAGRVARARVVSADRDVLRLEVVSVEDVAVPALRFVLVQALAKGGRDELAVESATEVGVDGVVPWQAERSVVVWRADRGGKSHAKWVEAARAAAKQSRRPRVPVVEDAVTTPQLVRRSGAAGVAAVFVLHEEATQRLSSVELPESGEVLLVVGPEGGVSPRELEVLVAAGAVPVLLGSQVLRSSTAGTAALSVLSARTGRW